SKKNCFLELVSSDFDPCYYNCQSNSVCQQYHITTFLKQLKDNKTRDNYIYQKGKQVRILTR
ncbi:hypothetical protein SGI37_20520, partial [Providencia rettgeri]